MHIMSIRNVIVAAFDDNGEFRDFLDVTSHELDAAKARGEAEQVEHLDGWRRPPGYLAAQAATRLYPKPPKGSRLRQP